MLGNIAAREMGMDRVQLQQGTLSNREREVLELVTLGCRNHEIADTLGVKERTVRFHIGNILDKLNTKNRIQAASLAIRKGWVAACSLDHYN